MAASRDATAAATGTRSIRTPLQDRSFASCRLSCAFGPGAHIARRLVPPRRSSNDREARIDGLLADGMASGDPQRMLSELAKLGARLIIQRAVEEEFDIWLVRARY
jgi:hypothetical protein